MSYSVLIESAISNAAPLEFQNGTWVPHSPDDIMIDPNVPRDGNHDYPLAWPERDELILPPYYVYADTPEELRDVVLEYHEICKLPTIGNTLKVIDREVRHEGQHGEAAVALGAVSCLYFLRICRNKEGTQAAWQPGFLPAGLKTTKIGLAVMNAYPDQLSAGDRRQIQELGYRSVAEVGGVAKEYGLPTPLQLQ